MDVKKQEELKKLAARLRDTRPLNPEELKRLREEFAIENAYDSNAIEGSTLSLRETALILQEGVTIGEKPLREHIPMILPLQKQIPRSLSQGNRAILSE